MPAPPGTWTDAELRDEAAAATRAFVASRLSAITAEQALFEVEHSRASAAANELFDETDDLTNLTGDTIQTRRGLDLARQLTVPPISIDDLDTLTDGCFGNWVKQKTDKGMRPDYAQFSDAAGIIASRLDRARAPWLGQSRLPTPLERATYIEWVAAFVANGRVLTERRTQASKSQEELTREAAKAAGYNMVKPPANLTDPTVQMYPATYANGARNLARTSMDVPIRLRTGHATGLDFLAVECKVSNSSLNSRKRLVEVTRKREVWDGAGAVYRFRTAAVLSGVFDLNRLIEAQRAGVLIFWAHRLIDLTAFLNL